MTSKNIKFFGIILMLLTTSIAFAGNNNPDHPKSEKWSEKQANDWYKNQGWLVGSNFLPSNAINQLEMWQAETFSPDLIDKELGWAADLGMNTMRVYLHDLAYENDKIGFLDRMDQFLALADKHGIKPMFVIFDSCWDPFPKAGMQRAPKPHVHNSGWVQSPGNEGLENTANYPRFEGYVKAVVGRFAKDERVLAWDVWNEPDNKNGSSYSSLELPNKVELVIPLLEKTFTWARSQNPIQPLTSGVWAGNWTSDNDLKPIEKLQLEQSDIITFHNYDRPADFQGRIDQLKRYNRPMICTEYMARGNGSTFEGFLPIAKKENVGMINWGFVDGKSQTKYPWDSWSKTYTGEPEIWFHDIFRTNGEPYRPSEVEFIKDILKK